VAWNSTAEDGSSEGIFARRFASNGTPATSAFRVNSHTQDVQRRPALAVEPDGDFVATWESNGQDGHSYGVFGRRFASSGAAAGGEFQVNAYTTNHQSRPTVAMLANGAFVVSWEGNFGGYAFGEILGRRFASSGAPTTGELQINTITTGTQNYPRVTSDGDDQFMVVWQFSGVKARTFGPSGADGSEFLVDPPYGGGYLMTVDASANADFVVSWTRFSADGDQSGVRARRFTAAAALLDLDQSGMIGALTDGLLLLRHRFGFSGVVLTQGAVDTVNCMRCDGGDIDAFIDANEAAFNIDGDVNGTVGALTDGLLVVRYLFGFRGATLVTGAVDLMNCTRCTAGVIEPYIAGLLP
jgi:hypothetical protein